MVLNWWRHRIRPTHTPQRPPRARRAPVRARPSFDLLEAREVLSLATFNQGFEIAEPMGPTGWNMSVADPNPGPGAFTAQNNATRVASGTNGIPSKVGSFHAQVVGGLQLTGPAQGDMLPSGVVTDPSGSGFTPYGPTRAAGYGGAFPAGGYSTSIGIYLDVNRPATDNDRRFDWSHAVSNPFTTPVGTHRRDFVFNVGFYDSSQAATPYRPGSGDRFVISASTNAGRTGAVPGNPDKDPIVITTSGWYMFEHVVQPAADGYHLQVVMNLRSASGALLKSWTLDYTNPQFPAMAADTVADNPNTVPVEAPTVGGNRYGWFASNEFSFLAIDDVHFCQDSLFDPSTNVTFSDNAAALTGGVKADSGGNLNDLPGAGDGTAQHSMIRKITIFLNAPYSDAYNPPGALTDGSTIVGPMGVTSFSNTNILNGLFTLERVQGMGTLAPYNFNVRATYQDDLAGGGERIELTFLNGSGIVGQSLADGNYNFGQACVTDNNNNMTPIFFWRFFGDADGDRDVDNTDLAAFSAANPSSLAMSPAKFISYFDYFADNNINVFDQAQFEARRPKKLCDNGKIITI